MLRTKNPYLAFAKAVEIFADPWTPPAGVHPLALVAADCDIASDASIGPYAVIAEGARIGARTIVHPHVVDRPGRAVIGDDCLIHAARFDPRTRRRRRPRHRAGRRRHRQRRVRLRA